MATMTTMASRIDVAVQFITVLVIFIGVLALAAYTTKWFAKYQNIKTIGQNIQVIETSRIAPNKYVQILKLGEKYVAIAVTKDHVAMLAELKEEELDLRESLSGESMSFKAFFEKAKKIGSENKSNPKEESK